MDNVRGCRTALLASLAMTGEPFLLRTGGSPRGVSLLHRIAYEEFDARHRHAPTEGVGAIDVLLGKALLATQLGDHDEARGLVVRATGVPLGPGAPAPPVLRRVLGALGERVFAAVDADACGDAPWYHALLGGIERPGDDVTVVALGALQAVAAVFPLPWWLSDCIAEHVEESWGPDPSGVADRVLAGRSDERDVVLDVLRVIALLEEFLDEHEREHEFDDGDLDEGEAGEG